MSENRTPRLHPLDLSIENFGNYIEYLPLLLITGLDFLPRRIQQDLQLPEKSSLGQIDA